MPSTHAAPGRGLLMLVTFLFGVTFSVVLWITVLEISVIMDPALRNPFTEEIRIKAFETHGFKQIMLFIDYYLTTASIVWQSWMVLVAGILLTIGGMYIWSRSGKIGGVQQTYKRLLYNYEELNDRHSRVSQQLTALSDQLTEAYAKGEDALIITNEKLVIRRFNDLAAQTLQTWDPKVQQLAGQHLWQVAGPLQQRELTDALNHAAQSGQGWYGEIKLENKSRWLNVRLVPLPDGTALIWRDITELKEPTSVSQVSQQLLEQVVQNLPLPCAVLDANWQYLLTSPAWAKQFGLPDELKGRQHKELMPEFPGKWQEVESELKAGRPVRGRAEKFKLNGQNEFVDWSLSPWHREGGTVGGYLLQARLVTQEVQARQRAATARAQEQHLAYHDTLTGLPNRQLFQDRLNMALANAYRQLGQVTLMFLDLDGFKAVNDTLGHNAGDMLLKEVGQRLKDCVRESDTVARLGGDEFTLILGNLGDPALVERVAQKVIDSVAQPYSLSGETANISTSIGISIYPHHASAAPELIKQADAAMYAAKQAGKNTFRFHGNKVDFEEKAEPIAEQGS